ncbi:MAG: polysaccharide deacetylase family protein [Bryobacteraceae bacterium]|nr:polysaccharide deacetylase family protein [Bryobacteraceae bacterium]
MALKRTVKNAGLLLLRRCGIYRLAASSARRTSRLLILGFHGISLADEHEWNPGLYITAAQLRQRMELLRSWEANVLPLEEALERLTSRSLPPRSAVITFDDGFVDFAAQAAPILREFRYPATLYLTTHYCSHRAPVFNLAVSYVLWKSGAAEADLHPLGVPLRLRWSNDQERQASVRTLLEYCEQRQMSTADRNEIAAGLAARLGVDYAGILDRRLLQILAPAQVSELSRAGIDIQLHTHRHRVPLDRQLFLREIEDNRERIREMTGRRAAHFCYPSGVHAAEFLPWLSEAGIESAVTCEMGAAGPRSHRLLLPRVLDQTGVSSLDFEAWLCGVRV